LCVLICLVISLVLEITVFQYSHYRSLGCEECEIASSLNIEGFTEYDTPVFTADREVKNFAVYGVVLAGGSSVKVRPELNDEGDRYLYPLSDTEINTKCSSSAVFNIYPYGKVHEIYAHFTIPEGAKLYVGRISINVEVPMDFKFARFLAVFLILLFLAASFFMKDLPVINRSSGWQKLCTAVLFLLVIAAGYGMSRSNPKLVSGVYTHHAQYRELAGALKDGHVDLYFYPPDERLKAVENPYDTSALLAEGIDYRADYAYYKGSYYVYFGILPELLLYYPYYLISGNGLSNAAAAFAFYVLLVLSLFALIWEAAHRFTAGKLPYHIYLALVLAACFFANNVFLISRPDIYNIPVLASTAFLTAGCALYMKAYGSRKFRYKFCICLGSFCLAATAGCRPQMLLYALPVFVFMLICLIRKYGMSRKTIPSLLAICLPWVIMAIPVCLYNHARFGSIFDFGATYSLTSNDMNHRGFNFDRLIRGLWCFLFQPPVYTADFPYLKSSILTSAYMGRNLTEFTFGGIFAAIPFTLAVFAPLFGVYKKLSGSQKALYFIFLIPAVIIAAFDVNSAGVLYRYTCDMAPGILFAAFIVWLKLAGGERSAKQTVQLMSVFIVAGLVYSLLVFVSSGDAINLYDANPRLFLAIREIFRP
ncbi:MAG: hypothetical protein K5686_01410, partial [Lachnospiraceae bacterium]|nr:hypothetical protein [Lachnospiraceae bacterium]